MPGRPGYDARRRNRNIGTARQGRGRDNRMDVPWPDERWFFERLVDPVYVCRLVHDREWHFAVEPTLADHVHACTIEDICRVLELLPAEDLAGLTTFVLAQPTRKWERLDGTWGMWGIAERLGTHDAKWQSCGRPFRWRPTARPIVRLDAQIPGHPVPWPRKLSVDGQRELERLAADGMRIVSDKRQHVLHLTLETCRATQLYRTLPHEIGHHVDYWRRVVAPSEGKSEATWRALEARYWSRPPAEREAFAHRYADTLRARMFEQGRLPFERIVDREEIVGHGMELRWFLGPQAAGAAEEPEPEPAPAAGERERGLGAPRLFWRLLRSPFRGDGGADRRDPEP